MAQLAEVDGKNFENAVLKSQTPVIVDFWAQWCGPCRKLSPVLEQIQVEFSDSIKIVKINGDENMELMKKYGVLGLPTLIFFKNGQAKEVMAGLVPKSSIISNIKKILG